MKEGLEKGKKGRGERRKPGKERRQRRCGSWKGGETLRREERAKREAC